MDQWEIIARLRKSHSARCGHVKRRMFAGEPLKGKTLEFALEMIASRDSFSDKDLLNEMTRKIRAKIPLTEYEAHILVDVLLVHSKIEGGSLHQNADRR